MTRLSIAGFGPARTWGRPGEVAQVRVGLRAPEPTEVEAEVKVVDVDRVVHRAIQESHLPPGATRLELPIMLPDAGRRGYGLRLTVRAPDGEVSDVSAIEALQGWWESPRHAAIVDYERADAAAAAAAQLASWHVNVAQHYDWMWRHHRYLPPDGVDSFVDALGRPVSHAAVRASIESGHRSGIASLAYGSVYGAEPEYVEQHPEQRVFDEQGEPLSLGGTFHINDIRPGSPWRMRLLGEYEAAMGGLPFDGIHMDTYGRPHVARTADGERIHFSELYPELIDEAAALVRDVRDGGRVLFNCVEGFPLDAIAPSATSALYLELWPPERAFSDVVSWIERARALADGRQVVIAAYAATLREVDAIMDRATAFEATVLLGAVISAAGGYHHTLAENDRILVEGYYPAAVPMQPVEVETLRALWRFTTRYIQLLSEPGLAPREPSGLSILDEDLQHVEWSPKPRAGRIWVRVSGTPDGVRVLHLIDLRSQSDDYWDAPKQLPMPSSGLTIRWSELVAPRAASPWRDDGDVVPLETTDGGWRLPEFERWLMVVDPSA